MFLSFTSNDIFNYDIIVTVKDIFCYYLSGWQVSGLFVVGDHLGVHELDQEVVHLLVYLTCLHELS